MSQFHHPSRLPSPARASVSVPPRLRRHPRPISWAKIRHDFSAFDGNGNVRALVKADAANPAASAITARYAYDGFGKEVAVSGADAEKNAFRFSTKQLDAETAMNYYGYRFYAADAGRWINRDPIVEKGGNNVYAMVGNDAILRVDVNGLLVKEFWDSDFWSSDDLVGSYSFNPTYECSCLGKIKLKTVDGGANQINPDGNSATATKTLIVIGPTRMETIAEYALGGTTIGGIGGFVGGIYFGVPPAAATQAGAGYGAIIGAAVGWIASDDYEGAGDFVANATCVKKNGVWEANVHVTFTSTKAEGGYWKNGN